MIFFADENISDKVVKLLEAFDRHNEVRAHKDHFTPGMSDHDWIRDIGNWKPKPVILGGDGRILTNPAELAALKNAQLSFMCLRKGWTNETWDNFAWKIIKVWPSIVRNAKNARLPAVFEVSNKALKVERVKTLAEYKLR